MFIALCVLSAVYNGLYGIHNIRKRNIPAAFGSFFLVCASAALAVFCVLLL